jgi:hypothetical protein
MSIVYKKVISMFFFSCVLCSVYSAGNRKDAAKTEKSTANTQKNAENKVDSVSKKKSVSHENSFVKGEGAYWTFPGCKSFIESGNKLKYAFRDMINCIENNGIIVPENSKLGLSAKKNGERRLKTSFSPDDVEDVKFLFSKSMQWVRSFPQMSSVYTTVNERLSEFHTETNQILSKLGFLSEPNVLCSDVEHDMSSADQETNSQLSEIKKKNEVLEIKTSLPSNISLEVRLVEGKARDLEPHLDDSTVCVFSIGAEKVYESIPWTRNARKKRYLEDGQSYLWFGTAHDILPSYVSNMLSIHGIKRDDITPLAHGVECKIADASKEVPVSLLLIVKKSQNNRVYIALPKTEENFQVAIGSKSDGLHKVRNVTEK